MRHNFSLMDEPYTEGGGTSLALLCGLYSASSHRIDLYVHNTLRNTAALFGGLSTMPPQLLHAAGGVFSQASKLPRAAGAAIACLVRVPVWL